MKRAFSALLVFALILSLAVTGYAQEDAYALYTRMNEAVGRVHSMDADLTMKVGLSMGDESLRFDISARTKQLIKSESDVELEMTMDMRLPVELGGQHTSAVAYYRDGWMYQEQLGERYKSKMDVSEMMEQAGLDMMDMDFTREDFSGTAVARVDGGREIRFVLSGDKMNEMIDPLMTSQMSALGLSDLKLTISDIDYKILIGDDDLPIRQEMKLSMEMSMMGETVEMTMDMVMNYTGFNTFWAILYPDWLENCLVA